MSKEDVQAYTKLLKFQKKRYGASIFDILFVGLSFVIMASLTILIASNASPGSASLLFFITGFYYITLLVAFFDYALGLGIFSNTGLYLSSFLILFGVIISLIVSLTASKIFVNSEFKDLLAFLTLVNILFSAIVASYYLTTKTPSREGRDEMITKLTEIKNDISTLPLTSLGSVNAEIRALKWIQFKQREDGIWGENNPLLETSEVLNMFFNTGRGLSYSWKSIVNGIEEIHTVEQTYYLILEALETAVIEPTHHSLTPLLIAAEIDPKSISLENEIFEEFKENLNQYSEWEFVKDIERYDEKNERTDELPIIFVMAQLFHIKRDHDVAQKCADIIANTFGILINRTSTRFVVINEKEVSSRILGLMYNALVRLVRSKNVQVELDSSTDTFDFGDLDVSDITMEEPIDDFTFAREEDMVKFDEEIPSLPGFDMNFSDLGTSLPDMDIKADGEDHDTTREKIEISTSLASIRNYLRSKQLIDGSWGGRIDITVECLQAVSDRESSESEFIKMGVHYLLALQEKDGSWQGDIILTSKVLTLLSKINKGLVVNS